MKPLRTFLLFVLVLGLGTWIWLHERHQISSAERNERERRVFSLELEQLTHLGIRRAEYQVDLQRKGQDWVLAEPRGAPANLPTVKQVLFRLRSLDRGELITSADMRERGRTLADFGLVVPRLVITLGDERGQREYRVGELNPLGNALYVKEESSQNVMLVSSDLLDILPTDPDAFRDRRLIPLEERDLTALVLVSTNRVIRLERKALTWTFAEPTTANADDPRVADILKRMLTARIEGFVNQPAATLVTGLRTDPATIRLHTRGREIPYEISVGGPVDGEPDLSYARIAGQSGLIKVSTGIRHLALTESDDLRDRRLLPLEPNEILGIALEAEGRKLSLHREKNEWLLNEPVDRPASGTRIERMIGRWRDARIEEFLPALPDAKALVTVAFTPDSPRPGLPMSFEILDVTAPPGRAWIRPEGGAEVWQVVPELQFYSPVDPLPYLSRKILSFDPGQVIRVNLRRNGSTNAVLRTAIGKAWTATDPTHIPDAKAIESLLQLASSLQAETLVELNPVSLEPHGLSTPIASLSIGLGGGEPGNRTLLFAEKEGAIIGTVQGLDLVFTLSRPQYETLTAGWLIALPPPPEPEHVAPEIGTP